MGASVARLTPVCGNEQLMHALLTDAEFLRDLWVCHASVSHFHHAI
jgi:hypothetical protein